MLLRCDTSGTVRKREKVGKRSEDILIPCKGRFNLCNRNERLKCNVFFAFRPGFYVQQLTKVPEGTYDVIPSTFYPGQEGPFILTIAASCKIALARK